MRVVFTSHDGEIREVEGQIGESLMQCATRQGISEIVGSCGGGLACATCHCYVEDGWMAKLPAPLSDETSMLEGVMELQPNSRLSCQIQLADDLDGLLIRTPQFQS